MNSSKSWGAKFDPYSRMQMEDGLPTGGVDVTVRITDKGAAAERVERAGLKLHAQASATSSLGTSPTQLTSGRSPNW